MPVTPPDRQAWFARRFPAGDPRNAMSPVHPRGWMVVGGFATAMALGALGFLALALFGYLIAGILVFIGLALIGAFTFILVAQWKGDRERTVADYRSNTNVDRR